MATENLEIIIGANTQDLQNGLNQASQSVTNFGNAVKTNTKPTADATNALGNLSRVAQDAPYGFMGIANNINPLLESFQRLVKESGGVGNALKSMASGLMGPAGIGLAVGAATSLIVAFGDEIIEMFASVSESDKAFAKLRDAFEENLKSVGSTIASDQALLVVINDINQSTEARNAALKKLKEEHKGYDELQKATINDTDALREMTDRLSDALVRKAKTEAIAKIIGEEYAKQVRLQTASVGEQINNLGTVDKIYAVWKGTITSLNVTSAANTAIENAKGPALKKNAEDIKQTTEALDKLDKKYKELTSEQYKKGDFNLTGTTAPKAAKVKDYTLQDDIAQLEADTKATEKWANEQMKIHDRMLNFWKKYGETVKAETGVSAIRDTISMQDKRREKEEEKTPISERKISTQLPASMKADQDRIKKFNEDIKDAAENTKQFAEVIATTLTEGFMTMFDAMSKGENPLQALGNYLEDLVKKFAAAIIQATIFQGIMMLLPGGAAAASAGGGFFGGLKKILGMAEGGIVSRPTLAMVGEGGQSEAVMPLNKLSNMMNSTFNAGAMSGAGGGGNGQFVLKGNDLVLALQRSNYSLNLRRGNGI